MKIFSQILEIFSSKVVFVSMFASRKKLEITKPVVGTAPVNMMNHLVCFEFASKVLFHKVAMFVDLLSPRTYPFIAMFRYIAISPVWVIFAIISFNIGLIYRVGSSCTAHRAILGTWYSVPLYAKYLSTVLADFFGTLIAISCPITAIEYIVANNTPVLETG